MTCQQYRTAKKAGIRIGFQCPGSCSLVRSEPEAELCNSNPGYLPLVPTGSYPTVLSELEAPTAIPVEADVGNSNPDNPSPVLTELLAPTFPEDDSDMWLQSADPVVSNSDNPPPPVLTDQAPINGYGLDYIPESDADLCMQPIEDPVPARFNPWDIGWSDDEDTIDPLPLAVDTTNVIVTEDEEPMGDVPIRVPEPAGTRYKLLKEAGCKPKNPNLPRPDHHPPTCIMVSVWCYHKDQQWGRVISYGDK